MKKNWSVKVINIEKPKEPKVNFFGRQNSYNMIEKYPVKERNKLFDPQVSDISSTEIPKKAKDLIEEIPKDKESRKLLQIKLRHKLAQKNNRHSSAKSKRGLFTNMTDEERESKPIMATPTVIRNASGLIDIK